MAFSDDDSWWAPGSGATDLLDAHPRLALLNGRIPVGPRNGEDPICRGVEEDPLMPQPYLPGPLVLGFWPARRSAYPKAWSFDPCVFFGGERSYWPPILPPPDEVSPASGTQWPPPLHLPCCTDTRDLGAALAAAVS